MFIKEIPNKKKGSTYITYRLVKSYRAGGESRHKNILDLGTLPNLPKSKHKALAKRIEELIKGKKLLFEIKDEEIENLAQYYYRKYIEKQFRKKEYENKTEKKLEGKKDFQEVDLNSFTGIDGMDIGGVWLCKQAIDELGITNFLFKELGWNINDINSSMLALIGRLLYPGSERRTVMYLQENSAASEFYSLQRGRINRNILTQQSINIYKSKDKIEKYISNQTENIFNIKSKIILYDLTNTHFEGQMQSCPKAKFGKNKQKRNDCRQITLGLIVDELGFPKHSDYFEGNVSEGDTFQKVITTLAEKSIRYSGQEKPVVIMDAGISKTENLQWLLQQGYDYICVSREEHNEFRQQIDQSNLIKFTNKSDESISTKLFTNIIKYEQEGEIKEHLESLLYVKTESKKAKDESIYEMKRVRFEKGLNEIQASLSKPRGHKKINQVHERIGRLKQKYQGISAGYTFTFKDNGKNITSIQWIYDENNKKQAGLGVYFIRTSLEENDEEKLWKLYRTINEVEDAFKTLKLDLDARPVYHQKEKNIEAHLNLCVLALFFVCFIRYRLKQNGINYRWSEIRRIMNTQKSQLNSITRKDDKIIMIKSCTRPQLKAKQIYQAMKYKEMPYYNKNVTIDV